MGTGPNVRESKLVGEVRGDEHDAARKRPAPRVVRQRPAAGVLGGHRAQGGAVDRERPAVGAHVVGGGGHDRLDEHRPGRQVAPLAHERSHAGRHGERHERSDVGLAAGRDPVKAERQARRPVPEKVRSHEARERRDACGRKGGPSEEPLELAHGHGSGGAARDITHGASPRALGGSGYGRHDPCPW